MRIHSSVYLLLIVILFSSCNLFAKSDSQSLQKSVNRYLAGVAKVTHSTEYKEARKIVTGDLDGDKDEDAIVLFSLEGFDGGNNWGQSIAAFINNNGVYKGITDEAVGGKFFRSFTLVKIENGAVIGKTETCPDDGPQGLCEHPVIGQAKYVLHNNKLVEVKE